MYFNMFGNLFTFYLHFYVIFICILMGDILCVIIDNKRRGLLNYASLKE